MVLAGKIFKLREQIDLETIAAKLKNYRKEESFDQGSYHFKLTTEIRDLIIKTNILQGVFSQDKVTYVFHRGEEIPMPQTIEAPFAFATHKNQVLLTVLEKKLRANNIANQLSVILFITVGYIVEVKIPPEVLQRFHEQNPEGTKIIFFDEVDIPNITKLSLYGSSLADTTLYNDYLTHGKIWYIVITSKKSGNIVGITRNGVVTIFSKVSESEYLSYVSDEIFPLIS
jgi:hypothetical protein